MCGSSPRRTATWPAWSPSGTFREDLWYRINVFPILLPRLRERIEDIPRWPAILPSGRPIALACRLVEPTTADLHLLVNYPWPGNIRELGAVIDRAAILGNGERLDVALALGSANAVFDRPRHRPPGRRSTK